MAPGVEAIEEPSRAEALLERARRLREIVQRQARRAFVVELTGTPKAGKRTSVAALQTFFKEAGFQVHLLRERAADCPLPMKGHFFFNAWTTATMLAEVLETHETPVDLLLLDRGFFDALVWLELQARRGQVTADEQRVFAEFVLLERWRSLVDVTIVMEADPAIALQREHQGQIVPREGSMMNPRSLADFNAALARVIAEHGARFSIERIDTSESKHLRTTNVQLLERLLPRIEDWADPEIAVVPLATVTKIFAGRAFVHGDEAHATLAELSRLAEPRRRSEAERDRGVVQLIAAGVLTHRDRIVVLERDPRDKKSEGYGRRVLWIGCHIERSSAAIAADLLAEACEGLGRRIGQELYLAEALPLKLLGLAWDVDKEPQHVGVMFRAPIQSAEVAKHLEDKQFKKMGRAGKLRSVFMTQEEISTQQQEDLDLEPWSRNMAANIRLPEGAR